MKHVKSNCVPIQSSTNNYQMKTSCNAKEVGISAHMYIDLKVSYFIHFRVRFIHFIHSLIFIHLKDTCPLDIGTPSLRSLAQKKVHNILRGTTFWQLLAKVEATSQAKTHGTSCKAQGYVRSCCPISVRLNSCKDQTT